MCEHLNRWRVALLLTARRPSRMSSDRHAESCGLSGGRGRGTVGSAGRLVLSAQRTHEGETMTVAQEMLKTSPKDLGGIDRDALTACIEACFECAQACTACA